MALREIYETIYHIYNHTEPNPSRPLALVGRHPAEDSATFSPLYRRIEEYMELKLFESTGIPLDRMLQMPSEYVRAIIEKAKRDIVKKGSQVDQQIRTLNREMQNNMQR